MTFRVQLFMETQDDLFVRLPAGARDRYGLPGGIVVFVRFDSGEAVELGGR